MSRHPKVYLDHLAAETLTVVCVADLHGVAWPEVPECDLLLVAGDVENAYLHPHDDEGQRRHLCGPFSRWLGAAPAKHKVGVAGNHDFLASRRPSLHRELDWHYLEDESIKLDGLVIHGSPWTLPFFDWAFMLPEEELAKKWELVPDDCDILVTHCPPYGLGDLVNNDLHVDPHQGSPTLRALVDRHPTLRLHVFGHIHEGYGDGALANGGRWVNASAVDEAYRPLNAPAIAEL